MKKALTDIRVIVGRSGVILQAYGRSPRGTKYRIDEVLVPIEDGYRKPPYDEIVLAIERLRNLGSE